MKLNLIFADSTDPVDIKQYNFKSSIEFPDEVLKLPDIQDRILSIATLVGKLTTATLLVSCSELHLRNYAIKTMKETTQSVRHLWHTTILCFERNSRFWRENRHHLKILAPIPAPFQPRYPTRRKGHKALKYFLTPLDQQITRNSPGQQQDYFDTIEKLAAECVILLNTGLPHNPQKPAEWQCVGFHPDWKDGGLINRFNKKSNEQAKQARAAKRRQERLEQKRQLGEVSGIPLAEPITGAGRRYGAVPGVFKGVQMRSQLELRFAAHIEEMGIRWLYETERLGEGQYLVDFYLPDLKSWVEVKGQFQPRDNYLLKEVAALLKTERSERLFVYAQSKAFTVNSRSFFEITHKEFWAKLMNSR